MKRHPAAREGWTTWWVVNCNPQRLDGPVSRQMGRIIDEAGAAVCRGGLERDQTGVGSDWDSLICPRPDRRTGAVLQGTVDGQMRDLCGERRTL